MLIIYLEIPTSPLPWFGDLYFFSFSAAELRVLYKLDIADVVSKATNAGAVTVSSILDILSRQLEVAECDVFGYLNVESDDLVILVRPVVKSPTMLQVRLHKSPTMLQVQLTWFSAICDTHISRLQRSKAPHRDQFVCLPSVMSVWFCSCHMFHGTLVCAFVEPAKRSTIYGLLFLSAIVTLTKHLFISFPALLLVKTVFIQWIATVCNYRTYR